MKVTSELKKSAIIALLLAGAAYRLLSYDPCFQSGSDVECIQVGCMSSCSSSTFECPAGVPALCNVGIFTTANCTVKTAYAGEPWGSESLDDSTKHCTAPGEERVSPCGCSAGGLVTYTIASTGTVSRDCTEYSAGSDSHCGSMPDYISHLAASPGSGEYQPATPARQE